MPNAIKNLNLTQLKGKLNDNLIDNVSIPLTICFLTKYYKQTMTMYL